MLDVHTSLRLAFLGRQVETLHVCQNSTLQVMAPKILELATWFVKKATLNQKSWLPNGDQAKTLTWRVEITIL